MTHQDVTTALDLEDLRRTIADIIEVDVEEVTDEARFVEDLEVDSLMALEITVTLEKKYSIKLDEAEIARVATLRATHDLLAERLA